jgi:predicted PhzF superfamily epimerase YddE/YHI9
MLASGRVAAPYTAAQGTRLGRTGRVSIAQADGQVWIGGATRTLFSGRALF